jgi:4-amino-4-deoxy-L-arabinose transferase-like glycosyltransferase
MNLDRLTVGFRPYLLLSLLCLILYLPGLATLPPLDRDESRFIQATRQMLTSGDYVRIQFQDEMRAKKPVGAYWAQAASVTAFSHPLSAALWPYRLPAAVAAWAAAMMTFAFGRSLLGARPALLAGIMIASALILVSEAHQAKTDAILLACTVAAQGALGRLYVAGKAKEAAAARGSSSCGSGRPVLALAAPGLAEVLIFWVAQGIGILVKGPMVPVISLLTLATLGIADRSLRWAVTLRPITGTLVAAAIAGPWFAAVSQATNGAFVGEAIKGDLLPKLLGSQESHGGWPGYYLLLAMVTLWPGSLLAWPAMVRAWGERRWLAYRFLLAWTLPAWVMFELVPTKLPHYVLPLYPAIALLTGALAAEDSDVFRGRAARIYFGVWILVGLALAAAVVGAPLRFGQGVTPALAVAAIGIVLATVLPAVLALRGRIPAAALALVLTAVVTFPSVFGEVMPRLDRLWVSRGIAEVVESLGNDQPVALAGFHEPSAVVLLGTKTLLTDGRGAFAHVLAHPGALAAVDEAELPAFTAAAQAHGRAVEDLGRVEGFNYSRGKPVVMTVCALRKP